MHETGYKGIKGEKARQTIRTETITIRGIVQGVGFRPTVYRIAQRLGMKGRIRNMGGVVQIVCSGTPGELDAFVREINLHKPPMARISGVCRETIGTTVFHEFSIGQSGAEEDEIAIIPADIAVCDDCLREFYEPGDPRHLHPFISCTNCGPRFSIMERLPYDRDTTTMVDFPMCPFCDDEYSDPATRRYHAQTISCHGCGPQPELGANTASICGCNEAGCGSPGRDAIAASICGCNEAGRGSPGRDACSDNYCDHGDEEPGSPGRDAIAEAVHILRRGGVLALKGVGGYYLSCVASCGSAVQNLREIKQREQKPFAVMFRDIRQIRYYCVVKPAEEAALLSPQRPIVLLEQRPGMLTRAHEAVSSALPADDPVHSALPADDPAHSALSAEDPVHSALPTDDPVHSALPADDPVQSALPADGPAHSALPADDPAHSALSAEDPLCPGVCNTSRFVGAFLPSFGLQYMLLDAAGPLIMTSANISELPLITDDGEMRKMAECEPLIGGVLSNERRIAAGLDDSVVRVIDGEIQLIRRSKGYVPAPVFVQAADVLTKETMIFAAGGHLKSAFSVSKGPYSYLSRHIGDLDSIESESVYRETFERMKAFFDIEPGLAVCDLHPRYYPTRFAEALGLPLVYVQHHHAHIASVMAEHGLRGPVAGISFDGTGYGTDGAIWGGAVLICEGASFERFSHLKYIDIIGGDSSMKDAWKSAVAWRVASAAEAAACVGAESASQCNGAGSAASPGGAGNAASPGGAGSAASPGSVGSAASPGGAGSAASPGSGRSSASPGSGGSAASPGGGGSAAPIGSREFSINLTGIIEYAGKHGTLEWCFAAPPIPSASHNDDGGTFHQSDCKKQEPSPFVCNGVEAALRAGVNTVKASSMGRLFDAACAMLGIHYENRYEGECAILLENEARRALEKQRLGGQPTTREGLALAFHMDVASAILAECRRIRDERGISRVCLSGGVFQNKILMEEALRLLRGDSFTVYYNIHVPPNDGGLALGQNFIGMMSGAWA